ncbi:hypothetical protein cypCar_00047434 [Cyprinus carpio]|nr:hypothetical protein cypCar_00047434 [Cyprinus carpio]
MKHASEFAHALGSPSETLLIIVGASVAGVLVIVIVMTIVFVNCHLRRKNRKLKRALSVRTEEMISLSRQVSMRRLNSINGDPRTADSGLHRDQSSPPPSMSSGLTGDAIGEGWKRGSRREIHRDVQRERVPEGEEESSAVNSYQLSEAVSNYFQCSNGGLTPKANTNGIIIHSQRSVM